MARGRICILVENFKPGNLEKLGLGWEVLHELTSRLILIRVSGYGQTGPYKDRPGFANIREAMGSIRYITDEPDRLPVRTGISLGDSLASRYAVIGAFMAVHVRGRGEGQVVGRCRGQRNRVLVRLRWPRHERDDNHNNGGDETAPSKTLDNRQYLAQ